MEGLKVTEVEKLVQDYKKRDKITIVQEGEEVYALQHSQIHIQSASV